jgi:phosphate transport system ATP-binding protein
MQLQPTLISPEMEKNMDNPVKTPTQKGSISIEDLNLYYGQRHALKNISIKIPSNKITAIIGPSGCGKTTLLRCFNRLNDSIDGIKVSGELLVDGENIYDKNAEVTRLRKKMGLLSQRPYPLPMSIFDNIAYGPRIHGITNKKVLSELVEHFLKEASLWDEVKDRLKSPASRLSIGQQQRLCLARGLAVEPEFLLGDEPTSALDPISSHHIEQKFIELKEKYTIVVVTHILRQARRIADYIIYMYLGEIIEHGPALEILENPKEKKTQEYIRGIIS